MNKRGISGKADLCVSLSFSLCRRIPSWFHRIPEWFGLAVPLKAPSPPLPRAGTAPGLTSLSQFRAVAAAAFPAQALPVFWAGQAAAKLWDGRDLPATDPALAPSSGLEHPCQAVAVHSLFWPRF